MMTAQLSRSIRDAYGRLHKRDERLTIVSRIRRADFDIRPLLKVRFQDGSTGAVFSEEVELLCAEAVSSDDVMEPYKLCLVNVDRTKIRQLTDRMDTQAIG